MPNIHDTVAKFPQIVYSAPFLSGSGYGHEAIAFLRSFDTLNITTEIFQHGDSISNEFLETLPQNDIALLNAHSYLRLDPSRSVHICHSEPGAWALPSSKWPTSTCPQSNAGYKIGRTMFETDRIPSEWGRRCNQMDEIWVPSEFHVTTFKNAGVLPSKLFVVGEPVDTNVFSPTNPSLSPYPFEKQASFRFLSIFKWEKRKGWDVLLKAYLEEFTLEDDVCLVIKTQPYHSSQPIADVLERYVATLAAPTSPRPCIELITEYIPPATLPSLYHSSHVLVQPSRGEGWGRPHAEAMAMGLVVIATEWSGTSAFLSKDNALPLPVARLVPVGEGAFAAHQWAEPCLPSLRALMREAFVRYPELKATLGATARRDMVEKYSIPARGRVLAGHMARIARAMEDRAGDAHEDL